MKTYAGIEVELHSFVTAVTMRAVNVSLRPLYPPRMNPGTNGFGAWVGPRASLDDLEKRTILCHYWESNPGSFTP